MLKRKSGSFKTVRLHKPALLAALLLVMATAGLAAFLHPPGSSVEKEPDCAIVLDMYKKYAVDFPSVAEISPADARSLAGSPDTVFVDVRTEEEQRVSRIPGALSLDFFMENIERYRKSRVIGYCTIGYRSGKFAEKMKEKGLTVENLAAGILGWAFEGGELVNDQGPTKDIHVYGRKWNHVPAGYKGVW